MLHILVSGILDYVAGHRNRGDVLCHFLCFGIWNNCIKKNPAEPIVCSRILGYTHRHDTTYGIIQIEFNNI